MPNLHQCSEEVQKHFPNEIRFLIRDAGSWTADLVSHYGSLRLPLHREQAEMVMAAANADGQTVRIQKMPAGRALVSFRPGNMLLDAANPAGFGDELELIALTWTDGRYFAWVAGDGGCLRVLADHEAEVILRRARQQQGMTPAMRVIARQQPYLFNFSKCGAYGRNDLAATLTPDPVPVEVETVLDVLRNSEPGSDAAERQELVEFVEVFGRELLHGRLVGAWRAS